MRPIDADELQPDTEWDEYYDGFTAYSESQIKNAPTLEEAIVAMECVKSSAFQDGYKQGRKEAIEEFRAYLKTVTPTEMPQEWWNIGVDNTCERMLKEEKT